MKYSLMIKSKKLFISFLLIVAAFMNIVQFAEATSMNFTVHGGKEEVKSISLMVEDHVLIRFTVVGSSDNALYFSITYPNVSVKEFGKMGYFNYPFVCDDEGEYILHFSNTDSTEDKLVTLDYEIQHYIFGIPQMLFLTIIIVLVCVAAVAVFIFMGKPR
jgi:hypothetical protein